MAIPLDLFSYSCGGGSVELNDCLKFCNLNPSVYKSHSFRIGAASFAAEHGVSNAQICFLGCWKSNAFHKCICILTLRTT
jgi:hypothetical protein